MQIRGNLRPELLDTQSAKETVLFANSPTYLLNRLRKDNSVSYVADTLQTDEIIARLAALCADRPKEPIDLVRTYVFLVALSLKDDLDDFRSKVSAIEMSQLQWGAWIRDKILSERIPTTVTKLEIQKFQEGRSETTSNRTIGTVVTEK